jgi:ABC-type Fe3+ transport system permease subunit
MARDDRSPSGEEVYWWHMLAHAIAFCAAAVIGAILLYPLYPRFEAQTDAASEAFGAYLTCIVIAAGIGPLVTLCLFGLHRLSARLRRSQRRTASFRAFSSHPLTKR